MEQENLLKFGYGLTLKGKSNYVDADMDGRPTIVFLRDHIVRPSIVPPDAPVQGSNGQLQVRGLLPGQQWSRLSDVCLQCLTPPTEKVPTKETVAPPAAASQLPALRPAISLAPTAPASTFQSPVAICCLAGATQVFMHQHSSPETQQKNQQLEDEEKTAVPIKISIPLTSVILKKTKGKTLTPEQREDNQRLFIYPPPPQTGGINITLHDFSCLNDGQFLNDSLIDFYLRYVFYEKLSDYNREKTHIFSCFFYSRLTKKTCSRDENAQKCEQLMRHTMVKTWTRHVDIFSKDFIVIPVNQNLHWFLAIICYPGLVPEAPEPPPKPEPKIVSKSSDNVTSTDVQEENKAVKEPNSTVDGNNQNSDEISTPSSNSMFESEEPDSEEPMPEAPDSSTHPDKNKRRKEAPCICIFDSLTGPNRSRIAAMLREYLEVEWETKKGTRKIFDKNTMQDFIMQCPQQNNYTDCGIYLLQYVESFFESPLPYFDSPIPNLCNWFTYEKVAKKRQELKDLILALKKKYGSNTPTSTATVTTPVRKQKCL